MSDPDSTISPASEPRMRLRGGLWRRIARRLVRLGGGETELEEVMRTTEDRGEPISVRNKDMMLAAARFGSLRVADVMRPRAEIVAIEASATLGEAARVFSHSQHSRLPIYRETLDDPLGLVHVRDVMALLAPDEDGKAKSKFTDRHLSKVGREILYVPASMRLHPLLLKMQSTRIHLALVVDEYGGTDGLISIEDLVEQIVGDIDDEHDDPTEMVVHRGANIFEVDGRAEIEVLEEKLGQSLSHEDLAEEYDTAAGLAMALVGRVPQRGEILHHPGGFDLEVLDADPRRVKRLRVIPTAAAKAAEDGGDPTTSG